MSNFIYRLRRAWWAFHRDDTVSIDFSPSSVAIVVWDWSHNEPFATLRVIPYPESEVVRRLTGFGP